MNRLIQVMDRLLKGVIVVLFGMIFLASITQVFFRYILSAPFSWGEELVRFINIWCVFLAAGYGIARGAHFGITFFVSKIPIFLQITVQVISHFLVIFLSACVVLAGMQLVAKTFHTASQMLRVPFGLIYLAIPIGFGLIGLFSLMELLKIYGNVRSPGASKRWGPQ